MDASLVRVLEATGYLAEGEPAAPSVFIPTSDSVGPVQSGINRVPSFEPDAWWRSNSESAKSSTDVGLRAFFKYVDDPDDAPVAEWQKEVWNQGFAPLLWIVSPRRIDLYNGFGLPKSTEDARENLIRTFSLVDEELAKLDRLAGRFAMETGQVWERLPSVNRNNSVDKRLLRQLSTLENRLVCEGLLCRDAQALIGRAIFAQYLLDGETLEGDELLEISGQPNLSSVFNDQAATKRLFAWLRDWFNGDMFPSESVPAENYLSEIGAFLSGADPETGQISLFPYRFDVIPVELISAIYEQFVHSAVAEKEEKKPRKNAARKQGVFYTPLTAVALVLDEIFEGLTGDESVLDLTCGSGVFLVEALRRLVLLKSRGSPTRELIRRVLYEQVYGIDISEEAIRIAAFSLYLAALELDPEPGRKPGLRFEPIVGRTLHVGDAFDSLIEGQKFDAIVEILPGASGERQGQRPAARDCRDV